MEAEQADFAGFVDPLASGAARSSRLIELLREDHPCYAERGAVAVNRMRASILQSLAVPVLPEAALPFVLEELDTGSDPWLLAVSARSLRTLPEGVPAFARVILDAVHRVRYRDQSVPGDSGETTVMAELLGTLVWLAPHARPYREEIETLRTSLPKLHRPVVDEVLRHMGT